MLKPLQQLTHLFPRWISNRDIYNEQNNQEELWHYFWSFIACILSGLFRIIRSVLRSEVGPWLGLANYRTSFGVVIDLFKTRNKESTLPDSHLPFPLFLVWLVAMDQVWTRWLRNCESTLFISQNNTENRWSCWLSNFCFLNIYCWQPDASSRVRAARGCEAFGISPRKVSSFSTLLLKCWAQMANTLLPGWLSPGDACARLEGELDLIVAVWE